ncbi:pyridoxamine 5'-phosphate oxidase family protein [Geomonas terrae]|uniref:Pyridoxamine 5'-phosphate oxidase family protein n=1 Tax=Geomonas terrae TaxID=2562681 RepID=A0A4V3NZU0_9BACT|nr:pyridoxamine 5'-phosphate oxidase family protein [Geomonas terrae]
MIPDKMKEVMAHEGVVAIVTQGIEGPHMVNTWNSYLRISEDGKLLVPVGYMHLTENNLAQNPRVLMTLGTREVDGTHGPGTGFLVEGQGTVVGSGATFDSTKAQFPWARAVLEIKVTSAKQTL